MSNSLTSEFFQQLLTFALIDDAFHLATFLSWPLVVYTPLNIVILSTEDEFNRLTRKYRILLARKGAVSVDAKIIEYKTVSNDMECYLVEQRHMDDSGRDLGKEKLRYYVRSSSGQPIVEMIEQLENPFVFPNCAGEC